MFTPTGQNIAAASLGSTTNITTTVAGSGLASYGNDMILDPATAQAAVITVNGGCTGSTNTSGDTWTLTFPNSTAYPVSSVVYINRLDACCVNRVNTSNEAITLLALNGSATAVRTISSGRLPLLDLCSGEWSYELGIVFT